MGDGREKVDGGEWRPESGDVEETVNEKKCRTGRDLPLGWTVYKRSIVVYEPRSRYLSLSRAKQTCILEKEE